MKCDPSIVWSTLAESYFDCLRNLSGEKDNLVTGQGKLCSKLFVRPINVGFDGFYSFRGFRNDSGVDYRRGFSALDEKVSFVAKWRLCPMLGDFHPNRVSRSWNYWNKIRNYSLWNGRLFLRRIKSCLDKLDRNLFVWTRTARQKVFSAVVASWVRTKMRWY